MDEFLTKLNKKFDDKYINLKLFDIVYDKKAFLCSVTFLYPQDCEDLTAEDRSAIANFIKEFFSLQADVKVKFKKSFLDSILVKKEVKNYFELYHKGITPYINLDNIASENVGRDVKILIKMNEDVLSMIDEDAIKQKLIAYLCRNFIANFDIDFTQDDSVLPDEIDVDDLYSPATKKVERYNVQIIKKVFGGEIAPKPEYIKNVTKPKTSVIFAGKTSNFVKKSFIIKKGKRKGEEKSYYSFILKDSSASIDCIYFCAKANEKAMDSISENCENLMLLIVGDVQKGLSEKLTYYIKKVAICQPVAEEKLQQEEQKIESIATRKPVILPEPIETTTQTNLFSQAPKYNNLILSNDIVVFDIETTGLDPENCEITEIGAVKISHGVIKERFGTFVKTENPIPEKVIELTHITNEMLVDAPSLKDAILDFYAFCDGCVISGYNVIGFDMKFIQKAASKFGIKFKNNVVDAFVIARQARLKVGNYTLSSVVKALGLTIVDAHRAYNDAFATAQVLLELSKVS